jgi:hypothetical protein
MRIQSICILIYVSSSCVIMLSFMSSNKLLTKEEIFLNFKIVCFPIGIIFGQGAENSWPSGGGTIPESADSID